MVSKPEKHPNFRRLSGGISSRDVLSIVTDAHRLTGNDHEWEAMTCHGVPIVQMRILLDFERNCPTETLIFIVNRGGLEPPTRC
jgi:hypothetical protein